MQHVTALFGSPEKAKGAAERLQRAGFDRTRISLVVADAHKERYSQAGEGLATGGALGAVAGGLVAIAVATVPGGILAAGPLAAALGAGAAGGGVLGLLVGAGLPKNEARIYEQRIEQGDVIVGVEAEDLGRASLAEEILIREGARHPPTVIETRGPRLTRV